MTQQVNPVKALCCEPSMFNGLQRTYSFKHRSPRVLN